MLCELFFLICFHGGLQSLNSFSFERILLFKCQFFYASFLYYIVDIPLFNGVMFSFSALYWCGILNNCFYVLRLTESLPIIAVQCNEMMCSNFS